MSQEISRIEIMIKVEGVGEAKAELIRFLSPKTVDAINKSLPLTGRAALLREEVYFETPVKIGLEKPKSKVETGDLAYWPMGAAFCIFYGKSQPYSPVNLIGKITENHELFTKVNEGARIVVEKA